jgi:voltage-gated sodium channel
MQGNADGFGSVSAEPAWRDRLRAVVEMEVFQHFIVAVIVVNAVVIGLETWQAAVLSVGPVLEVLDGVALAIFVAEIALKLTAYRMSYFRNPWNVFDFTIVAVALIPAGEGLSVLRALRVLRAMRLISMIPRMRLVVQGLLGAIPAMGSVLALLALVFYVFSVMATKLFGEAFPQWFGSIGASLYSLFQIMTLESWSMGIVRPVMEVYPLAWVFFVPFILITTFAVLNLFIAIIVNSMHEAAEQDGKAESDALQLLTREIGHLRAEVSGLRESLRTEPVARPDTRETETAVS